MRYSIDGQRSGGRVHFHIMILGLRAGLLLACLALGAPVLAADDFEDSIYVRFGLGSRLIPSADFNRAYDTSSRPGGVKPQLPDQWAFNGELALGYQSPGLFGLELGFNGGGGLLSSSGGSAFFDYRFSGKRDSSGGTYEEGGGLRSFYLMPSIRLPAPGLFGKEYFHTFGLQVGAATLSGWNKVLVNEPPYPYSYYDYRSYRANAFTYGAYYRIEQMLGQRVSLGLDLGYTWATFNPSYIQGGDVPRADGTPLTLDLSGPNIRLSLGVWILRPFIDPVEEAAAKAAREQRAEARRARRRRLNAPDPALSIDAKLAERLLTKADAHLDAKNYPLAVELYQEVVDADPSNRWGWKGLGQANYGLGKKEAALRAYEKAYSLSGVDERLKRMIERVESEIRDTPLP